MADILTQIQDELDMLLNQMQSSLAYIKHKAPPAEIPGQPLLSSFVEHEAQAASQSQPTQPTASNPSQPTQESAPSLPTQSEFDDALRELARDLVLKEQQIEVLIASLPGLNTSEKEQIEQMKQLEKQLEDVESERLKAVKEKELLIKKVEEKILGVGKAR